jgi:steroid 5-alpha reductase family enzyme
VEVFIKLFGAGALLLLVVFTLTWMLQLKTKNAGIVDTVWSASFPMLAILYFFLSDGYTPRKILILIMVLIWGLRLAGHLFLRTIGHKEDSRYTALRNEWGDKQNILMLRFFYFQAILALVLSLPYALIMVNPHPELHWIEYAGAAVWLIAFLGEATADQQLRNFQADSFNKGKVCNVGLWYYSRHPNYFFEWLIWVSVFITALGSEWGVLSIICPSAILYFLLKVTGIPYTETQSLKSRGQAYVDYQKTTSPFIPLPKRKGELNH